MLWLRTLGCPGVSVSGDADIPTQRRRLALLALLARAGARGLTRDKLIGFLWGDRPQESARHSLDQALYALRQGLGTELILGTDPLRLNPSAITVDVMAFEAALREGALARADALYTGPFLDGLFLDDAPEFESWMERERLDLSTQHIALLERLARDATSRGLPALAVGSWQRLASMDPLSTQATLGLMHALAAAGDRPAAVRQAQIHEAAMRAELDCPADAAILALAAELRRAPAGAPSSAAAPVASATRNATVPIAPVTAAHRRRTVGAIVTASAAAAVALTAIGRESPRPPPPVGVGMIPRHLAIVPFQVVGPDTSLAYLHDGIIALLGPRLVIDGSPEPLDARVTVAAWRNASAGTGPEGVAAQTARALGADGYVEGQVTRRDGGLVLAGAMRSTIDGSLRSRAEARGPNDSLPALIDQLAAGLLIRAAGEREDRYALLVHAPPAALREYLAGRADYHRGDNAAAMAHYRRALDLDPTFAVAGMELTAATGWLFAWAATRDSVIRAYQLPMGRGGVEQALPFQGQWVRGITVAWNHRDQMSPADLAYLTALRGSHYPQVGRANDRLWDWERAVAAAPERADGWYRLGYVFLYQGVALGFSDAMERAAAAFRRARELEPGFMQPLAGMIEVAARTQDTVAVRRLGREFLLRDSVGGDADYVRWHVAAATGDEPALLAIRSRFDTLGLETLDRIQWTSQVEGIDLDDADRAMNQIVRRAGETDERIFALFHASMLALNRGRPREALRLARLQAAVEQEMGGYWHYRLLYGLYWNSDSTATAETAQVYDRMAAPVLARSRPVAVDDTADAIWLLTQWRLWHGDTTAAARMIRALQENAGRVTLLEAILSARLGRADAALLLARSDSLALQGCCTFPHFSDAIVARLHEQAGDLPGALAAWQREAGFYAPEYLSVSLREEARLATMTGDMATAIRAYRHYLALHSKPEPGVEAEVKQVRDELRRLQQRTSTAAVVPRVRNRPL